jgi:hypothetical protein
MKKLIVIFIAAFSIYLFAVNDGARNEAIKEIEKIQEEVSNAGGGNKETNEVSLENKNYTEEEIAYFNEVALSSEFSDNDKGLACKWESDINIFVAGEKSPELISELHKVVGELNNIINPININIVNDKSESNYIVFFGSEHDFHNITPSSVNYTGGNWGLFVVNSGQVIRRGSMYVDIYRCTKVDAQKHLLREELTQSLGLFNDSYKYENSIFQQSWTTTTEYAPIDVRLIEMLYNN